jgi:hypothetical protein
VVRVGREAAGDGVLLGVERKEEAVESVSRVWWARWIENSYLKTTMAVPSLNIDSPAITMVIAGGAPSWLSRPTTATGSVADRIVPMTRDRFQPQP